MKEHKDLVVTKSDNENVTVLMNREIFVEKCMELLSNKAYYTPLRSDPTYTLQQETNKFVSDLLIADKID